MDEEFEAHRLKPGDEGWKYDNEVDFSNPQGGVIESSAWDDDDDDSDMEFWYVVLPCLPVRLYNISEPGSMFSVVQTGPSRREEWVPPGRVLTPSSSSLNSLDFS